MDKPSVSSSSVDLFAYDDYHALLRDWFAERKNQNPSYSFQALANRAGLKSRSFLRLVTLGRKDLSPATALAVAKAMALSDAEAEYFVRLVEHGNSTDPEEKSRHLRYLERLRPGAPARTLSAEHYDLFGKWYIPPIWDLVTWFDFGGDFRFLASRIRPEILPAQAKHAVELLLELGLIEPHGKIYRQKESTLQTRANLKSQAVKAYQADTMRLGQEAIGRFPLDQRHVGTITLGLDAKAWQMVEERIQEFRQDLIAIAQKVDASDRVCQVNLQAFPLTAIIAPEPSP